MGFKKKNEELLTGTNSVNDSSQFFDIEIKWLTTEEAAAYLKISPKTLLNLTSNGKVKCNKFGRRNRYRLSVLNSLLFADTKGDPDGN